MAWLAGGGGAVPTCPIARYGLVIGVDAALACPYMHAAWFRHTGRY